jgi:hypothetical protein
VAPQELGHAAHLILIAGSARRTGRCVCPILVQDFKSFSPRQARCFESARPVHVHKVGSTVGGAVCRSAQQQDRRLELRDAISCLARVAGGIEDGGARMALP